MSDASRPAIYPRYCFDLAPTFNSWCLMRASDLHRLEQHAGFQGENFFFYKNLPIKWVRVVGVIVAIHVYAGQGKKSASRRVYTVDDSSGACIEAMLLVPSDPNKPGGTTAEATQLPPPYRDMDVGAVIDIKGWLSTFRDEKQINIDKTTCLKATTHEVALWEKRDRFRRDVLDKPWVLDEKDIRKCRKEAERSEADGDRRRQRLAAKAAAQRAGRQAPETRTKHQAAGSVKDFIRSGKLSGKYDALGL